MTGRVNNKQLVTVALVGAATLSPDDIVLCRVRGEEYLHLIKAMQGDRYQIGNNRGGVNGWTGHAQIFGKLIAVEE
jgi:hypothetical protein